MLRTRAQIFWFEGHPEATRDDALAARAQMTAYRHSSIGFELDGITALACAAAPSPACPGDIDEVLAANLRDHAIDPHPRMLAAWIALARRQLDSGNAGMARDTIERGIDSTRNEVDESHPLRRAAQIWRILALDADGDCDEAARATTQLVVPAAAAKSFPWLVEAENALADRTRRCPSGQ